MFNLLARYRSRKWLLKRISVQNKLLDAVGEKNKRLEKKILSLKLEIIVGNGRLINDIAKG